MNKQKLLGILSGAFLATSLLSAMGSLAFAVNEVLDQNEFVEQAVTQEEFDLFVENFVAQAHLQYENREISINELSRLEYLASEMTKYDVIADANANPLSPKEQAEYDKFGQDVLNTFEFGLLTSGSTALLSTVVACLYDIEKRNKIDGELVTNKKSRAQDTKIKSNIMKKSMKIADVPDDWIPENYNPDDYQPD